MAVLQEHAATGHDFLQRSLAEVDPEIADAIKLETQRQNETLELIASENHVSRAVLTAMGSVFTNKYAEGYPGKRYYGGCGPTDIVENIAIQRAKKLFGAEHANVQPHSGSQANMAVYFAGLVVTGNHPSPIPYADFVTTTTHKTLRGPRAGLVLCKEKFAKDLDRALFPGVQGGPLVHIVAAKAVSFQEALSPEFKEYQTQIVHNAKALAQAVGDAGFRIVSGGTDNHLFMTDVFSKGITGKDGQNMLEAANITVNKNTIPFDTQKPMVASGLRIGTPAVTTRGLREPDMKTIAQLIARVLDAKGDTGVIVQVKKDVKELCDRFPIY